MRVCINGIGGRMGRRIADIILKEKDLELSGGIETEGHGAVGKDIGRITGNNEIGINVETDIEKVMKESDCIIDFTNKEAASKMLEALQKYNIKAVIGTTGLSEKDVKKIQELSKNTAIVHSPNMSIGINLLFRLAPYVAEKLGENYDIEIIESHHRNKLDAPSGTAMKLAENISKKLNRNLDEAGVYGRKGFVGERTSKEIGVLAVRGGDIVGEHTVMYIGAGERIEITHRAHSRDTFAMGAVKAAGFLIDKDKGLFNMLDVLGIN